MSLRNSMVWAALLLGVLLPGVAAAECITPPAINRGPSLGSPFATRDVTRMDTQTSDAVKITGGCIDGTHIGENAAARGHFSRVTTGGPSVCDGFVAADGATTAGTFVFTSASAGFTAADADPKKPKVISIRKAGAKFFVNSATVSSGGTGHGVGDLVNFADGVQIFVVAVSAGAITDFYIVNRGSAATDAATLEQFDPPLPNIEGSSVLSGSPVGVPGAGGTGAVITPVWMRENLVTTIAGFTGPTEVTLAASAAATVSSSNWGYGTDYGPEIQAALDAGTQVLLPPGICGHSNTLTMTSADVLVGQGALVTTLAWLGAANQPQIFLGEQAGARHSGMHTGRMELNGLGAASKGWYSRGVNNSEYYRTSFIGHTTVGHDIHGNDAGITSINNTFGHLTFEYNSSGYDINVMGMWWGFPNTYDTGTDNALSQYSLVEVKTLTTTPGFLCGAADHNSIVYIQTRAGAEPHVPPGIEMFGGDWATLGHCRNNQFVGMDAGQGGLKVRSTGWTRAPDNIVGFYDRGNGGADYAVEAGGSVVLRASTGRWDNLMIRPRAFASLQSTLEGGMSYVVDSTTKTPGAIVAGGGDYSVPVFYDNLNNWRVAAAVTPRRANNVAHQSPTGTTDTGAFIMMGMGATAVLTPNLSGTVMFSLSGRMANSVSGSGVRARMRYGTGTAPANGAAEAGSSACANSPEQQFDPVSSNGQAAPFNMLCVVEGLTPGTQYWFDASVRAITGGTASVIGVSAQAMEQ